MIASRIRHARRADCSQRPSRGYKEAKRERSCPTTLSATCSASPAGARATGRRSAAWSMAARRGIPLTEADIQPCLDKRRPGPVALHDAAPGAGRGEDPLRRVHGGRSTTGTPIALVIENTDQRSKDYGNITDKFRPGHADYTYWAKYGIRDYRGGGRASARETAIAGRGRRDRAQGAGPGHHACAARWCRSGRTRSTARTGIGTSRAKSVLLPGRRGGAALGRLISTACARPGSSAGAVIEVVASGVPGRARRAGLRQARPGHRQRADEHQRGEGRRDRRRLRRGRAARRGECRRDAHRRTARPCSCRTMPAAFSAASRPARTSSCASRSSRPARS